MNEIVTGPDGCVEAASRGVFRYRFDELFDISSVYRLTKEFSDLVGISSAIIGVDGHIWIKCNWQEICANFHRKHPEVRERCLRSDTVMASKYINAHGSCVYRCKNGLYEAAAPICVQGEHIANLYMGQFFQEPPDVAYFMAQAERFGFDKTPYIQALLKVPVFPEDVVKARLAFFVRLAALIGEMGLGRLQLMESNEDLLRSRENLQKAQQELINAQKMEAIANLATGVAHDFNNFAQIIGTNAELLLAREDTDSPRYRKLREIEIAVSKTSDLTQRLLMFRGDGGGERQTLDVNQLLDQVSCSLAAVLPSSIDIEPDLAAVLKIKSGDQVQLFQAFMNLILNARDSMPDGGTIAVQSRDFVPDDDFLAEHPDFQAGRFVSVSVMDQGRGLSDADLVHMLEPFYSTKQPGKGHGLGLTAVYNSVKSHDGHILYRNRKNEGACITIYLPAIRDCGQVIQLPVGGYETILLVDDDPCILNSGREYLHSYGYTVLEAMTGEGACETYLAHQKEIDLVIMDLVMPGMGGEKCIDALLQFNPDVRVLVASAYLTDSFISNDLVRRSIKGFISKPYIRGRLLQGIRMALDQGQVIEEYIDSK